MPNTGLWPYIAVVLDSKLKEFICKEELQYFLEFCQALSGGQR